MSGMKVVVGDSVTVVAGCAKVAIASPAEGARFFLRSMVEHRRKGKGQTFGESALA